MTILLGLLGGEKSSTRVCMVTQSPHTHTHAHMEYTSGNYRSVLCRFSIRSLSLIMSGDLVNKMDGAIANIVTFGNTIRFKQVIHCECYCNVWIIVL